MTGPTKGTKGYLTSTTKLMGPTPIVRTVSITIPTGTLWQQQGIIEWIHLGHS
jgi:type IV secretory pathway TraG/TraD family ATPase VirD4